MPGRSTRAFRLLLGHEAEVSIARWLLADRDPLLRRAHAQLYPISAARALVHPPDARLGPRQDGLPATTTCRGAGDLRRRHLNRGASSRRPGSRRSARACEAADFRLRLAEAPPRSSRDPRARRRRLADLTETRPTARARTSSFGRDPRADRERSRAHVLRGGWRSRLPRARLRVRAARIDPFRDFSGHTEAPG